MFSWSRVRPGPRGGDVRPVVRAPTLGDSAGPVSHLIARASARARAPERSSREQSLKRFVDELPVGRWCAGAAGAMAPVGRDDPQFGEACVLHQSHLAAVVLDLLHHRIDSFLQPRFKRHLRKRSCVRCLKASTKVITKAGEAAQRSDRARACLLAPDVSVGRATRLSRSLDRLSGRAYCCEATSGGPGTDTRGCFGATSSGQHVSLVGRQLQFAPIIQPLGCRSCGELSGDHVTPRRTSSSKVDGLSSDRHLSGWFRRPPTFASQVRPAAGSLVLSSHTMRLTSGLQLLDRGDALTVHVDTAAPHLDEHGAESAVPDIPLHAFSGKLQARLFGELLP